MLPSVELIISKYKEYLLVSNYYVQVPHARRRELDGATVPSHRRRTRKLGLKR